MKDEGGRLKRLEELLEWLWCRLERIDEQEAAEVRLCITHLREAIAPLEDLDEEEDPEQYEVYFTEKDVERLVALQDGLEWPVQLMIFFLKCDVDHYGYALSVYLDLDTLLAVTKLLGHMPVHYHTPVAQALRDLWFGDGGNGQGLQRVVEED